VKISLLKLRDLTLQRNRQVSRRLLRRKSRAVKNWHARAMKINPNETKIAIVSKLRPKQVPLWVYKKYEAQYLAAN